MCERKLGADTDWESTFFHPTKQGLALTHGLLNVQRDLSLLGSNFANVGVLIPAAVKTRGSFELGVSFGMIR